MVKQMIEISIPGLSPSQCQLADIIWELQTQDEVDAFIDTLPAPAAQDAKIIVELICLAYLDQMDLAPANEAQVVIDRVRSL